MDLFSSDILLRRGGGEFEIGDGMVEEETVLVGVGPEDSSEELARLNMEALLDLWNSKYGLLLVEEVSEDREVAKEESTGVDTLELSGVGDGKTLPIILQGSQTREKLLDSSMAHGTP